MNQDIVVCSEGCLVTVGSDSLIRLTGLEQERGRCFQTLSELFGVQSEVSNDETLEEQQTKNGSETQQQTNDGVFYTDSYCTTLV